MYITLARYCTVTMSTILWLSCVLSAVLRERSSAHWHANNHHLSSVKSQGRRYALCFNQLSRAVSSIHQEMPLKYGYRCVRGTNIGGADRAIDTLGEGGFIITIHRSTRHHTTDRKVKDYYMYLTHTFTCTCMPIDGNQTQWEMG